VFTGAVAPDFSNQVHDFNPGIEPDGRFWTTALDDSTVDVDLHNATARLNVKNLELQDFFNVVNALLGGPSVDATVSFDMRWEGEIDRFTVHDPEVDFEGRFIQTSASVKWSGENENGDSFTSTFSGDTAFAAIGRERNGVFAF
jgi:hypothetical protein